MGKETIQCEVLKKPNRIGRPPKYSTNEELVKVIDDYFDVCEKYNKPLTITGLASSIGLDRHQLINYGKKSEFYHTIKKAKQLVEAQAEERLYSGKNPAGTIFSLKNNYGWVDETISKVLSKSEKIVYHSKLLAPDARGTEQVAHNEDHVLSDPGQVPCDK